MKKPTILCIDDESIILLALKQELKLTFGDQYSISTALSAEKGREVLDNLRKEGREVKLVICDWLMPGTKGDAFLTELRRQDPSIKFLVITGHADNEAIDTFKSKVQARILYKPWQSDTLISTISELLRS